MATKTKRRTNKKRRERNAVDVIAEANGVAPAEAITLHEDGTIESMTDPEPELDVSQNDPEPAPDDPKLVPADVPKLATTAAELCETDRKASAFDSIVGLNDECREAFQAYHQANEIAKAKKKTWEGLCGELHEAIRAAANPEPMPLFDKQPSANGTTDHPATDESWREVKLEDAMPELSKSLLGKLNDAQLYTVGELSNWTAEDGGRHRITDVPGIGPAAAEKIENAMTAFWQRRKDEVLEKSIEAQLEAESDADAAESPIEDEAKEGDDDQGDEDE